MSSPSPAPTGGTLNGTAILYVPGIHHENPERELDILAQKLARALDQHAADGRPTFFVEPCQVPLGNRTRTGCRLLRRDSAGGAGETVADLFELNYRDTLLEPYRKQNALAKILTVMLALAVMLPAACWRWFRPRLRNPLRTTSQRGHVAYALFLLACVVLYLVVLTSAGVKVLLGAAADRPAALTQGDAVTVKATSPGSGPPSLSPAEPAATTNAPAASIPSSWRRPMGRLLAPVEALWHWATGSDSRLFVLLTSVALLVGPGLRDRIKRSAEQTVALGLYFGLGLRRPQLLGGFDEAIEALGGQAGYTRCCVIAYSFGSILALDALFPPCERRAARLDRIETLITIGSPHDLILTYWPRYFDGRHPGHPAPRSWVNVYLPADVLSSRFNREPGAPPTTSGSPDAGLAQRPTAELAFLEVQPDERLGFLGWISLLGLRSHSMYWSAEEDQERSCLGLFVAELFPSLCKKSSPTPTDCSSTPRSA